MPRLANVYLLYNTLYYYILVLLACICSVSLSLIVLNLELILLHMFRIGFPSSSIVGPFWSSDLSVSAHLRTKVSSIFGRETTRARIWTYGVCRLEYPVYWCNEFVLLGGANEYNWSSTAKILYHPDMNVEFPPFSRPRRLAVSVVAWWTILPTKYFGETIFVGIFTAKCTTIV